MTKTIHIFGLDSTTKEIKGVGEKGDQLWGLNQGHNHFTPELMAQMTHWFQIHAWPALQVRHSLPFYTSNHLEFLRTTKLPVYLQELQPDECPTGIRYPYEEVVEDLGGNYFSCNSFGWMLALAIHLGWSRQFRDIQLYGVDFGSGDVGDSYARPMIEYLIGLARGRGMQVTVPEHSALLKEDLYGKNISVYANALEMTLDVLRAYSERLPYMADGLKVRLLMAELESRYHMLVAGGASVQECCPDSADLD